MAVMSLVLALGIGSVQAFSLPMLSAQNQKTHTLRLAASKGAVYVATSI
jgi:hypothetical protein